MDGTEYISVRRLTDAPFGVLLEDLISDTPTGYDLSLMRRLTHYGLVTPLAVRPLTGGRFKVVGGLKRLAAVRMLVQTDKMVHDRSHGMARPAREVFALIRCRFQARPAGWETGRAD